MVYLVAIWFRTRNSYLRIAKDLLGERFLENHKCTLLIENGALVELAISHLLNIRKRAMNCGSKPFAGEH